MGRPLALALVIVFLVPTGAAASAAVVGDATFAGGPVLKGALRLTTGDGALDLSGAVGEATTLRWDAAHGRLTGTRGSEYANAYYDGEPFTEPVRWGAGSLARWTCLPGCRAVFVADGMGHVGLAGDATGRLQPEATRGRDQADVAAGATVVYAVPERAFLIADDGQHLQLRDAGALLDGDVRVLLWGVEATVLQDGRETLLRTGTTREAGDLPGETNVQSAWLEVTLQGARLEGPAEGAVLVAGELDWSLTGALAGAGARGWVEVAGARHELRAETLRIEGEMAGHAAPTGAVAVAGDRAGGAFAGSASRVVVGGHTLVDGSSAAPAALIATGAAALLVLWALLKGGAMTVLYSRLMRGSVLDHPTRRAVYEHVKTNPGAHIAELSRALAARRVTLRHHLRMLEAHGFVSARPSGRVMAYFPAGEAPSATRIEAQVALKGETRQAVLEAIRASPVGVTQADLTARTGLSQRLVSYHLARLEELDLVRGDEGRPRVFRAQSEAAATCLN